jgi:hypothetical protein
MKNGTFVKLNDGRTGFVVATGIDGATVHLTEGRITTELVKDLTIIEPPTPVDLPPIQRTPQHIQTNHAEPPRQILVPAGVGVMRNGQWPNTTWPLGEGKP